MTAESLYYKFKSYQIDAMEIAEEWNRRAKLLENIELQIQKCYDEMHDIYDCNCVSEISMILEAKNEKETKQKD